MAGLVDTVFRGEPKGRCRRGKGVEGIERDDGVWAERGVGRGVDGVDGVDGAAEDGA